MHRRYYIKMSDGTLGDGNGGFKYAFWALDKAYDGVASGLGVKVASNTEKGLVFGANSPKPVVIYFDLDNGRTARRFCDPQKVNSVLNGSLNGKTLNGGLLGVGGGKIKKARVAG